MAYGPLPALDSLPAGAARKTVTCRYWALGPKCPNFDAFGTDICQFAHWDTGRVASHIEQRGTCLPWRHLGYCGKGVGCWYEHRNTGVTGLYQGTVELDGFELQIADAANKAGFNTWSHDALFDLIWAVKRVALRQGVTTFDAVELPKDLTSPDRRARSIREGTRKRRAGGRLAPKRSRSRQSVDSLPSTRNFCLKKRPHESIIEENLIDLTSSDLDVNLTGNSTPASVVKRQKRSATDTKSAVPDQQGDLLDTDVDGSTITKPQETRERGSASTIFNVTTNTEALLPRTCQTAPGAETEIIKQLLLVKTKFDEARKHMNACQTTMKTVYETHHERLGRDDIMTTLHNLSSFMNTIYDGGRDGAVEVDKAVTLVRGWNLGAS